MKQKEKVVISDTEGIKVQLGNSEEHEAPTEHVAQRELLYIHGYQYSGGTGRALDRLLDVKWGVRQSGLIG